MNESSTSISMQEHPPPSLVNVVEAGLADILTVHDAEGRYVYASPSFQALTGLTGDQVVGRSPFDLPLIHDDDLTRVIDALATAMQAAEPVRLQYRLRRHDGIHVWVESLGSTAGADGQRQLIVTTREMNHVESLMQGLGHERRLKSDLDELVGRQRRFLTTVSHRARTPLTAVVGIVKLLQQHGDRLDDERRHLLLDRLEANSDELMQLLVEVTEADRLSRSDLLLERRVVDLHAMACSVIEELTDHEAHGHSVINHIEPGCTAVVDRDRVRRLLVILLDNALRHAGEGATVELGVRRTADGVQLVVEDDGPGVPPARREAIFEPFTHGETESADPGSGLGLYVVAELAALHGGRAWVDPRPGGGARFHVWLPRPRGDAASAIPAVEQRATAALTPATQTVVDRLLGTLRTRSGMDSVYLSILDGEQQHVLATSGHQVAGIAPGRRIPLADTYCTRVVSEELEHVVPDTTTHPVVMNLPATTEGLSCYVGVPVHLSSGQVFGTLCGASANPRHDLPEGLADEFAIFADILGEQLADEGFIDGTALDSSGRIADVLTRPGALHVALQPVVALDTGTVTGVEALLRFDGHDRPTSLWFADAVRSGLLVDLEVRALELALARLEDVDEDVRLHVNVSPDTLFSEELALVLSDAPLHRIVLELTEHATVEDHQPLRHVLAPLRERGLQLALDDVGTGHGGLGHILHLQPDILKASHSLISTITTDPVHLAATSSLVRMARQLDVELVAEGIETSEVLHAVREVGFTHAQGHLLARPGPTLDLGRVRQTVHQLLGC